ncbi:hypothetical protein [uncultured Thiodictyon sp.]|uniref:hypothetical protein n=1 Tax=uncultured Thiodictyon sp. TaxID=1846217 RepID=UPI0025DB1330|nr:hypothetical protein [uncultured Thiodictyon sp.]
MSKATRRMVWAHLGDHGVSPAEPPAANEGLMDLGAEYFEAEQPHPDSVVMAHHMLGFLDGFCAGHGVQIRELADALEEALWQERLRVEDGRGGTLYGLTVVPGVRRGLGAAPTAAAAGLKEEVVSRYAGLAALCDAWSAQVAEPLRTVLEVQSAQLRCGLNTLLKAFQQSVPGAQSSLVDDLAVCYGNLAHLHMTAARQARRTGTLGATVHAEQVRVLLDMWEVVEATLTGCAEEPSRAGAAPTGCGACSCGRHAAGGA